MLPRRASTLTGIAVAATLGAWGCTPPASPAHGVDYFKAHPDEARATSHQCTAGRVTGPNCDAAEQAIASAKADATFNEATKMSTRKNEIGRKW